VTVEFEVYYTPWQRWVEARAYPVPEGGLAVFFLDITARKEAEEALARHATALHFANQDLRQIAYLSAHDLQEQIRTVSIYTQLLAQEYGPRLEAPMNHYVENVVTASTHLSTLLHDVLTYLALDHDERRLVVVEGEVLWQQIMSEFQEQIIHSKASVTHDSLPIFQANADQFALVFRQLLDNALKFHRPETPPRVHVWAEPQPEGWQFAVRDQGIGLMPDYAESIFGVGKRLHSRGRYPGTGMGLAICKKIVNQHGGRIWVDSILGGGVHSTSRCRYLHQCKKREKRRKPR
jgi:light-regulated signal transduction histidine kinase (bacteriophytochrome)